MNEFLAGQRVLVVEDEMMILMNIEAALSDMGCDTFTVAGTVDRALAFISSQPFDLAMLDVNLDGQASYPIADALALRGIPYLFSTGYGDHGVRKGYDDRPVLKKPYRDSDLAAALSGMMPVSGGVPALA